MRFTLALAMACAVSLAIIFLASQQGSDERPAVDASRHDKSSPAGTGTDATPGVVLGNTPRSDGVVTAPLPDADRVASVVNWSRDVAAAMVRAEAGGRLLLVYVGPPPDR